MKNKENNRMQADIDLSNVVETAEYINVYESGEMTTYSNRENPSKLSLKGGRLCCRARTKCLPSA